MHLIITDAWMARSRPIHLTGSKLLLAGLAVSLAIMLAAAGLYHWVFVKGAQEGWPLVGSLVKLVTKEEADQRDRYLRENIDAMARRVGEMQARLLQLESLGERVSGLAGMSPGEIRSKPGLGGALVSGPSLTLPDLNRTLTEMEQAGNQRADLFTVMESRLFDQKIREWMIPTQHPVQEGHLGSAFGWRIDPITGRSALHTGLDFSADRGTAVFAAAGGVVVTQSYHPEYGNMIEIDHGNDLVSRYAHTSRGFVKKGDLVKRGQKIAEVGTTGRSTGPHLHFEVLARGIQQDPRKFLDAGQALATIQPAQLASRITR